MIVLDCSAAATWAFEDEFSDASQELLAAVARDGALVPAHFPVELANVMWVAEQRRRLAAAAADAYFDLMAKLPIEVDGDLQQETLAAARAFARRHDLSPYDAAYLALAARRRLAVGTGDDQMIRAAATARIAVHRI